MRRRGPARVRDAQDRWLLMLETLLSGRASEAAEQAVLLAGVERAAGAIGRLDEALDNHPLLPAFLYRARLDAVRRQAAVDGRGIDPWHLAAVIEGLRLRMPDYDGVRIIDRCEVFDAAHAALGLHQWLVEPDFDQEGEVQAAARHLAGAAGLAGVAEACWFWLNDDGGRAPMRAALVRVWMRRRILRAPVPLTGPRALAAEAPDRKGTWVAAFLEALASEATDHLELLRSLERVWLSARARVPVQRRTSRAALAVDVLAATPLLSATTLGQAIGMSIKGATELLDRLVAAEIVVEVTRRSARRLFGLAGLAPLRDAVVPPRRPIPGRGRGRPRHEDLPAAETVPAPSLPPISRFERPPIDYTALEEAMAHCDQVVRAARVRLRAAVARGHSLDSDEVDPSTGEA